MRWRLASGLLLGLLLGAPAVAWAVPTEIVHEGMILDEDGIPVQGQVVLSLGLYEQAEGGEPLWFEEYAVELLTGYYVLHLGEQSDITGVFDGGARYLGISVDGEEELSPRHAVRSVPYALVANNVVGDITPSSIWVGDGQVVDSDGNWTGPPPMSPEQVLVAVRSVDGDGSGLDADRLDGIDSTRFFQPAEDGAAGLVLGLVSTLDGSGSGLDADELDGLDSSDLLVVADASAPGTVRDLLRGADGSGSGVDADLLDGVDSTQFLQPAAAGAGTAVRGLLMSVDGSGSGVDADLLDGVDSSKFMRVDQNTATSGVLTADRVDIHPGEIGGGNRAWMTDGVKVGAGGSDNAYFGMKDEGGNAADTVIAWGDDVGDDLRLIFARSGGAADGEEHMRVTSDGKVGIGTASPTNRLDVNGSVGATSLRLVPQDDPPANPVDGEVYLDAETNGLRIFDGDEWVTVAGENTEAAGLGLAYGVWTNLNNGADPTNRLGISVTYTKKQADSLLRLIFSSNMRTNGGAGSCCQWNLRVNGSSCSPEVNGNVYINPGGNYHQHHTFNGICSGVAAGTVTVEPWVETCPGYGNHDCYTGWESMTALIVEEIPNDAQFAHNAWNALNYGHDATQALPISVAIDKQDSNSLLEVIFSSSMRTYWGAGSCCRWALRLNGAQCNPPVNGNVYLSPASDPHHIRTITGMCPGIGAGRVTVQPWIEQCPGYGNADCYTGWQSTTSLMVRERNPNKVAYGAWQNINRGEDATQAVPGTAVQYLKKDSDSLLRLTLSSNLRTNGGAGACCRWALRVNDANCNPAINGNVYISPGGNYHHHRTITGMCPGVREGNITVQPWLEQCPGYGNHDCYTGWQSTTWVIVEEGPF